MNIYETDIMNLLNENEAIMGTDTVVLEVELPFDLPEEVGVLDRAKYKVLFKNANAVITGEGGKKQPEDIINLILDALKLCLSFLAKFGSKFLGRGVVPKQLKITIIAKDTQGMPFKMTLNPIGFLLDFVISALVSKLFEMAVAPVRAKAYIKSYKEMISRLEQIKRVCKDPETEQKCDILIEKINKAIKSLESKIVKEVSNMRTLKEAMFDIEESINNSIVTESDLYDSLCEAEAECLDEDEFVNHDIFVNEDTLYEGKKCTKCENADEDDEDDVEDDFDESCLYMEGLDDEF